MIELLFQIIISSGRLFVGVGSAVDVVSNFMSFVGNYKMNSF